MPAGTLKLHRRNGLETFDVEEAEIFYSKDEDGGFAVNFSGQAGTATATLPDSQGLCARPNFEFTLLLPKAPQAALAARKSFHIPIGHDEAKADYWTRLYYVEHQPVDEVTIRVLARAERRYRISIVGHTPDVVVYDGSQPAARLEIEAEFTLKM